MKILKILPISFIAFLAVAEGRAAEGRVADEETQEERISEKKSNHSLPSNKDVRVALGDLKKQNNDFSKFMSTFSTQSTPILATLFKRGDLFSSIEGEHNLDTISSLVSQLEGIQKQLTREVGTLCQTPIPLDDKEPEIIKKELTAADFVKFYGETEIFKQDAIEFSFSFNPQLTFSKEGMEGTIDVKDTFKFLEMNAHLQHFQGELSLIQQGLSSPSEETIFYERDLNNPSHAYKKGLFGLKKVIEEMPTSLFFQGLHENRRNALLEAAQKITAYMEEHKA